MVKRLAGKQYERRARRFLLCKFSVFIKFFIFKQRDHLNLCNASKTIIYIKLEINVRSEALRLCVLSLCRRRDLYHYKNLLGPSELDY